VSWEDPMVFDGRMTWICWTGLVPGLVSRCEAWNKKVFLSRWGKNFSVGNCREKTHLQHIHFSWS
jgi:hypothetical protein